MKKQNTTIASKKVIGVMENSGSAYTKKLLVALKKQGAFSKKSMVLGIKGYEDGDYMGVMKAIVIYSLKQIIKPNTFVVASDIKGNMLFVINIKLYKKTETQVQPKIQVLSINDEIYKDDGSVDSARNMLERTSLLTADNIYFTSHE